MIWLAVLAHQGGWDEVLFVLVPLAVLAWLLAVARRRVDRLEADGSEPGTSAPGTSRPGVSDRDPAAGNPPPDDPR